MRTHTPAEAAIRAEIERRGSITFRRFMEMALYSAPGSYYGSGQARLGARGDFYTSPVLHPAFGALVARQVEQIWGFMGQPVIFSIVEMGAGTGALARDILSYTARFSPEFHRSLNYILTDRSPAQLSLQRETVAKTRSIAGKVSWLSDQDLDPLDDTLEGCILSNELLDALPVHAVASAEGGLREIYVTVRDGLLTEILDDPSDAELVAYFERLGFFPPEGCRAEVNLDALDWMSRVAGLLRRGAVITIDYGYPARELYSQRHCDGTLLCFYRHTLNDNPYVRIGLQDMTTHVDFTTLARKGADMGLAGLGISSQSAFLSSLGMAAYLASLSRAGLRQRDYEGNRASLMELVKAGGLGRVQVMIQGKGLDNFAPAGFRAEGLRAEDLGREFRHEPVPLRTSSHIDLTAAPRADDFAVEAGRLWSELKGEEDEETGEAEPFRPS